MNEVKLTGRVVNQLQSNVGDTSKCMFNVEVKRSKLLPTDKHQCDYPRVTAFDEVAENFIRTVKRGDVVKITGWIHVAVIGTDGFNRYVTEIIAENIEKEEAINESI